jgi:hypothetical protein
MGVPHWLYYLSAVAMLLVAAYCLVLLVLSFTSRDSSGRDIDIAHILMGVSMAGMFVPTWAFGSTAVWELIFGVLLVWFITASIVSVQRFGLHVPHALVHAAMSLAMILMYVFPMATATRHGAMSMAMSGSSGSHLDSGLAALLALLFCGSAIFTLASPNKGASHHGSHRIAYAASAASGSGAPTSPQDVGSDGSTDGLEATVALPWLEDLSHVVMVVGMAFMLVLMT